MVRFIVPLLAALLPVMFAGMAGAEAPAGAQATRAEPTERTVQRCRRCGTIESKREIPGDTTDPKASKTYEYSLRMADGSSSVFQDAMLVSWRLGERVRVLDGISSDRAN